MSTTIKSLQTKPLQVAGANIETNTDSKLQNEKSKTMNTSEALQVILFLPKASEEFNKAKNILLSASDLDEESIKYINTLLKNKKLNQKPKLPLTESDLNKFPNLFSSPTDGSDYRTLTLILNEHVKLKNIDTLPYIPLSKVVLDYFQNYLQYLLTVKAEDCSETTCITLVYAILEAYYGREANNLFSSSGGNLTWKEIGEIEKNIKSFLCMDVAISTEIPSNLIMPLRHLKRFLCHHSKEFRLLARDICENFSIPLDLAMMLSLSVDGIEDGSLCEENSILITGLSGSGKSTLASCLNGVEFSKEFKLGSLHLVPKQGQGIPIKIGFSWISQTLYPERIKASIAPSKADLNFNNAYTKDQLVVDSEEKMGKKRLISREKVFYDLAGFKDSRKGDNGICASLGLPLTVCSSNTRTRAIIVVLPYDISDPNESKAKSFKTLALILSNLIKAPQNLAKNGNLLFVISKPRIVDPEICFEPKYYRDIFIERMMLLKKERLKEHAQIKDKEQELEMRKKDIDSLEHCKSLLHKYCSGNRLDQNNLKLEKPSSFLQTVANISGNKEVVEKGNIEVSIEQLIEKLKIKKNMSATCIENIIIPAFRKLITENQLIEGSNREINILDAKISALKDEYKCLDEDIQTSKAERDLLNILENNKDNLFVFRGYKGSDQDDEDDVEVLKTRIDKICQSDLYISRDEFHFDTSCDENKEVLKWAKNFSEEISPTLKGLIEIPKSIKKYEKEINDISDNIVKYEK